MAKSRVSVGAADDRKILDGFGAASDGYNIFCGHFPLFPIAKSRVSVGAADDRKIRVTFGAASDAKNIFASSSPYFQSRM